MFTSRIWNIRHSLGVKGDMEEDGEDSVMIMMRCHMCRKIWVGKMDSFVSDLFGAAAEFEGDVVDDVLSNQHALRHPKASEGRVGWKVGFAGQRTGTEVRDVVGIIKMEQDFLNDLAKLNQFS